jgi:nucleotide-binding universal stress UspA family protein
VIKVILVAMDGSKLAERVLPVIATLATRTSAEVVLATAVVPRDGWTDTHIALEWEQEEQRSASAYLKLLQDNLLERGIRVRGVRAEWGRPHVVINQIADAEDADLVALTTHGRGGFARWVTGSVADKVLRTSHRPLLLVRSSDESEDRGLNDANIKRILVPLDGSALSESVLPFLQELAARVSASLVLLNVVVPTLELSASFLPGSTSILEELKLGATIHIERVAKRIRRSGVSVETSVVVGHAAEAILDAATHMGPDLIALSTHGRSGPARWALGSVADAVIRRTDRPCLVVPDRVIREKEADAHQRP